jgi:hypothetical protein
VIGGVRHLHERRIKMTTLEKIVEAINIPKTVVEKADKFLSTLLGSAVMETGELITDKIRFRRFRNQIIILQRAEELLKNSNLTAKEVSLKILVPLIEKGSLEENPSIQEMWANLLANASSYDYKAGLHAICIEVLSSISPYEASILNHIWFIYEKKLPRILEDLKQFGRKGGDIPSIAISFKPEEVFEKIGVANEEGEILLDNLLRLNLIKWEVLKTGAFDPSASMHLTSLGMNILRECMRMPMRHDA